MPIRKKIGDTVYSPTGIHRKIEGVEHDIQAWYKGVVQNGSVVGVKVFEKQQPIQTMVPLEYCIPANSVRISTSPLKMNKGWEIIATIQAATPSAEFFIGYSYSGTNAYLACENGVMKVYGASSQYGSKALGTNKTVIDINCHMADIADPGGAAEYDWMFLNVDWDGHTQSASAGFQVAFAKVTDLYNNNQIDFYTDGNIKLFGYSTYTQEIDDKTTKTKTHEWLPYWDEANEKVVFRDGYVSWSSPTASDYTPGPRKDAVEIKFVNQVNTAYIYDNKIWADFTCYKHTYPSGSYITSDGWLYTIASDGTYVKSQTLTNTISGYTRYGSTDVSIKINGTAHSVTSDTDGYFELDCSPYYPITSLFQCVYNTTAVKGLKVDVDTSHCTNFSSAFSNLFRITTLAGDLDLSTIDMSASTTWLSMFYSTNYATIILPPLTHNGVTTSKWMFYSCYRLTSVDISSAGNLSTLSDAQGMFQNCNALTEINFSGVTNFSPSITTNMFSGCSVLSQIKVEECDNTTINTLISALSDAGFTFIQSGNYLIKQ